MADHDLDLRLTAVSGEFLNKVDPVGGAMNARRSRGHVLSWTCWLQPEMD
jgi:hypothetical protein